tara:strand:+ start:2135 stop:3148 length:1014 start_codon:yes stop_codon:yes gene_type:complete
MNEYFNKFIQQNKLDLFRVDPYKLRGQNFFKEIFNYRKEIYNKQKKRIKKDSQFECNVCKNKKGEIFLTWKKTYKLIKCKRCGAVNSNISHIDESEFIDSVYNDKNYTRKVFKAIYKNYNYRKNTFGKERYEYTIKRLKLKSNSKVLDLGCGFGYFLNYLKTKKINYKGIEPSKNTAEFCKSKLGLNVISGNLVDEKDYNYDLITLFDVIEHLKDPCGYFKIINKKLKKNGYCVAYTPNIHSLSYALMGSDQNTMLPFEHLSFFNDKSFKFLAQKTNFKVYSIETYGFDIMDFMLFKEYNSKVKYSKKFLTFTRLVQSIIDKNNLSNHFRVTFKKIK